MGVQHITDGTSQTVCVSETIVSDGTPGVWDGVSPTNGFVLALGGDDKTNGPQLVNYPADCSGPGLKLNMTRGVIWIYGARVTACTTTPSAERPGRRLPRRPAPQQRHQLLVGPPLAQRHGPQPAPWRGPGALFCDGSVLVRQEFDQHRRLKHDSAAETARRSSRVTHSDAFDPRNT